LSALDFHIARVGTGVTDLTNGMSVADLEISTSFYRAIGFEIGEEGTVPPGFDALAELDGVPLRTRPMSLGAYRFQLMQWGPRRDPGPVVRLPLNRNGDLIHVGTHCDAFDAMLRIVVEGGGSIVERTRAQFPPPDLAMPWRGDPHGWVFTLDPNGVQIEIVGPTSVETSS
jgi:catechol 2,3-dioxygenase-like lactoylglutathione lyase family enzyme